MDKEVYYRLITLWICCEVMLGSIIHFFKFPASGLILGSCSVICISLIAHYSPKKGSILKAMLIVALFKLMLTPQVRATAYIAVFFQGLLGESLFWNKKMYRSACLLLGTFALLESGLQRIIVLTIVYGKDLWEAMNIFIHGLTKKTTPADYSFFIILGYAALHAIVGAFVGLWCGTLPKKIHSWINLHQNYLIASDEEESGTILPTKKKRKFKKKALVIWMILSALYLQSHFSIGRPLIPEDLSLRIFVRSLLILMTSYFIIGPFLTWICNRWLQKSKIKENLAIQNIMELLPRTKQLVMKSWKLSSHQQGRNRIYLCCKIILLNGCHQKSKNTFD